MSSTTTATEDRRGGAVGAKIDFPDGHWIVPDHPIIPFIEGDGDGPRLVRAWHHPRLPVLPLSSSASTVASARRG